MGSLHSYLEWNFWVGVVGVVVRAAYLSWADYPRKSEQSRASDVISIGLTLWFVVWAYVLLNGAVLF